MAEPASPFKRLLRLPYVAAAVSACVAAALFKGSSFFEGSSLAPGGVTGAVREAALEIGIASIGLWFAAGHYLATPIPGRILAPIGYNLPWIVAGCIVLAVFTATMGRGIF